LLGRRHHDARRREGDEPQDGIILASHQSAAQVSVRPPNIGDVMPVLAGWDSSSFGDDDVTEIYVNPQGAAWCASTPALGAG